jgi:UDP-glucose 4-epimerase
VDLKHVKEEIGKRYSRAMVTGGAGFIGSHVIEELLDTGIDVVSIDSFVAGKEENIAPFIGNPRFKSVRCDITDYDTLKKQFDGVDIVFHQAASKKNVCLKDPRVDLRVNGEGTFNLLELSRDRGVKKFIHASTGSVYGEAKITPQTEEHPLCPVSYYGVSKLAGERYVKAFEHLYGLDATVLRYFHVYGPRQESGEFGGVIAIFIRAVLSGNTPVIFGDGKQERSFTYVKDCANANLFVAVTDGTKGQEYNCASGINVTVGELFTRIIEILGRNDMTPKYSDWLVGDIKKFDISNAKLCSLGFEFLTGFDEGLRKTIEYYKMLFGR